MTPIIRRAKSLPKLTGKVDSLDVVQAPETSASTRKTKTVRSTIPKDVPIFYSDLLIDVVYGVHTSKLVFGTESGDGADPVAVVVIPTASLLTAVLAMTENLTAPNLIQEMNDRYVSIIKLMRQNAK